MSSRLNCSNQWQRPLDLDLQLAEGLSFLHKDVKLLHRNICPESIIINSNGAWKLAGFELYATNINEPNDPVS